MRTTRGLGLGALAWASSIQFFVAQAVVQSAWTTPYSLSRNYISDLGNTSCGLSEVGTSLVYVCSPWHAAMNVSFVVFGIGILLGCVLVRDALPASRLWLTGLALVAVAGPGAILVGVFPEDLNLPYHKLGAGMQFISGNAGLVVVGIAMWRARRWPSLAAGAIVAGAVGLVATGLFVAEQYLGLGIGGMERAAAYPLPIWLIAAGICFMPFARGGNRCA